MLGTAFIVARWCFLDQAVLWQRAMHKVFCVIVLQQQVCWVLAGQVSGVLGVKLGENITTNRGIV